MLSIILSLQFITHLFISLPLLNYKPPEDCHNALLTLGFFFYSFYYTVEILGNEIFVDVRKYFFCFFIKNLYALSFLRDEKDNTLKIYNNASY